MTTTTITDVRVFDGTAVLQGSFDVTFGEQGISTVTAREKEPAGSDTIIDGTGKTLLPGLIDAHVHLDSLDNLRAFTNWGVTTVLDMGSQPKEFVDSLRGQRGLADVRSSGSPASGPGGIQTTKNGFAPSTALTGPDQAERFIDDRINEGSDYIKIIVETPGNPAALTEETIAAVVAAAHAKGFLTIAHAASTAAYQLGVDANIDFLTHAPLNADATPDLVAQILAHEITVIPTLTMMRGIADRVGMPSSGAGPGYRHAEATVRAMKDAGIPILAGTDANNAPFVPFSPVQGESLHDELALLVDAGLSPTEALRSATSAPAALFGLAGRGSVREGSRADLLLVTGDPTADIRATRNIDQVWIAGIPAFCPSDPRPSIQRIRLVKLITLEEHYLDVRIARASAGIASHLSPDFNATFDPALGISWSPSGEVLQDLDDGRIADMDANGISMQVLSGLSTQQLPAEHAGNLVANLNNTLAAAVGRHPDRFAAFASLPTALPEHVGDELERCVRDLSMVGAMVMGRTEDQPSTTPASTRWSRPDSKRPAGDGTWKQQSTSCTWFSAVSSTNIPPSRSFSDIGEK